MDEAVTTFPGAMVIDGQACFGTLAVTQELIPYRSEIATKPDLKWSLIDDNKHFHAYAEDGKTPTLDAIVEHIGCDGSCGDEVCEGYDITRYVCHLCQQSVEPGRVPDREGVILGRYSWSIEVDVMLALGAAVSVVVIDADGVTCFGFAQVTNVSGGSDGVRSTLVGASSLGKTSAKYS
jgi:hypothetical protein